MKKSRNELKTRRLIVRECSNGELPEAVSSSLPPADSDDPCSALYTLTDRKSGAVVGALRSARAETPGSAEIELSLLSLSGGEAEAAEALKGGARLLFARHGELKKVETWLNPDISAIRILEKAGYERVFEGNGVIRYEKTRPAFPVLALVMLLFTGAGFLLGAIFDNYPLFTCVGIASGILPGALIASFIKKRRFPNEK